MEATPEDLSGLNPRAEPTALSLAAEGGAEEDTVSCLWSGAIKESGLGLPLRDGAQLVLGVGSSSDPKLRKSSRSGDGSAVSMDCVTPEAYQGKEGWFASYLLL